MKIEISKLMLSFILAINYLPGSIGMSYIIDTDKKYLK